MKFQNLLFSMRSILFILLISSCTKSIDDVGQKTNSLNTRSSELSTYYMPDETQLHEGTWLQWPHHYEYGLGFRNKIESTWIAMTKQLIQCEKVHIIAYNSIEKNRILKVLATAGVSTSNIDFKIMKTNDVWVRDNGPIFVKDNSNQNVIEDWGFNGWGYKVNYTKCNSIPTQLAKALSKPFVNLNMTMVLEGGAFEIDGNGVFLATKSSILNSNRNPGMSQVQAETILSQYLGISKFIWLDGVAGLEITDMHIDGFARFGDSHTIVTMQNQDLIYWEVPANDISTLYNATDIDGQPYNYVYLPLTKNNVKTTTGKNLGYKGSYVNYYVANTKVLMPYYNDVNDNMAKQILQNLYPTRTVVGIDVRNLYENGGMVHCITQQQPL